MKRVIGFLSVLALTVVLSLTACLSDWTGEEGTGTVTISIGSGASSRNTGFLSDGTTAIATLTHIITMTDPQRCR
ncbi:MAG: hypothetical protein LBH42_01745 [Treponema sp.]|nr:hypothetical protein [Treponema sp.]